MEYPIKIDRLRKDLISGKIDISELANIKDMAIGFYQDTIKYQGTNLETQLDALYDFIMLCLDYYTYSETGDTLISDHQYDELVNIYRRMMRDQGKDNKAPIYADNLSNYTTWPFIKHEAPGMVGSVGKIYTENELRKYMGPLLPPYGQVREYIVGPKYDGVSACIKVSNHRIVMGITRADGITGQDITEVVRHAKNPDILDRLLDTSDTDIYFKCELCVSKTDFAKLVEEKAYANRRSATTGIINTPKNLEYAKYISIIPLASYNGKKVYYFPPDAKRVKTNDPKVMLEEIDKMLEVIRHADYEFRTDGVVIYPLGDDIITNYSDIMDNAIAYKVNTEEALTEVLFGYMSVGRLGYAVPMLRVKPVEVNETIVEDVSLGSYDKFAGMDIHEGETVIIYSAGNVIPQVRMPENRHYKANADYLKIKKRCPYCDEKLERIGNEYKCTNEECPRVQSGVIANFLVKLGADGISDATIEDLFNNKLITDIPSIFKVKASDIAKLEGYGEVSANNIVQEIERIKNKEISISLFMGALGIPDISEKKCRNIFKHISIKDVLEKSEDKLRFKVLNAEKTGDITATTFAKFVINNRKMIEKLVNIMNIVNDKTWKGNVVFTGFRNPELESKFNEIGYEISDSVNNSTVAVISASYDDGRSPNSSGKLKSAYKKGISIVHLSQVDDVLKSLKKG